MDKFIKKFLACTLCATMVLGTGVTVFADDEPADTTTLPEDAQEMATGEGKLEGYVTLDVTKLVLPTSAVTSDFTLDPQGLLHVADPTNYKTESGAVYFTNAGTSTTYSDTSDAITIKNKSSYAIDVTMTVKLTAGDADLTKIKLAESKEALETAKDPSLYFGVIMTDAENSEATTTAITKSGQTVDAKAAAVPLATADGADGKGYELKAVTSDPGIDGVTASPNGKYYYYDLTSGYTPGDEQTITFKLTGATNDVEGWEDVDETVKAAITYTIKEHVDAYVSASTISSTSNTVNVTLPEDVTISSIWLTDPTTGASGNWSNAATVKNGVITFTAASVAKKVGCYVTITYSDEHTDKITIE
jgi:hypothetical protein